MVEVSAKLNHKANKALINNLNLSFSLIIGYILLAAMWVHFGIFYLMREEIGNGIMNFALAICYPLMLVISSFIRYKTLNRSMKLASEETTINFRFGEDKFYQETVYEDSYRQTKEMAYCLLYRIYENREYFFLYTSYGIGHAIKKENLAYNDIKTLREWFRNEIGHKFKRRLVF